MQRKHRAARTLVLLLSLAPFSGCSAGLFRIQLPGFRLGDVDGVWLWRESAGSYERVCRIEISDPFVQGGVELVRYLQFCLDGRPPTAPWHAAVERLPGDADTAKLALLYQPGVTAANHRASAYNAAGESGLSSTSLRL